MKLTMNIDDDLLTRVMETTGAKTKTEAIHAALAEIDRRHKLIALLAEDIAWDWEKDIDPTAWDLDDATAAHYADAMRAKRPARRPVFRDNEMTSRVAEEPPKPSDRRSRSRR